MISNHHIFSGTLTRWTMSILWHGYLTTSRPSYTPLCIFGLRRSWEKLCHDQMHTRFRLLSIEFKNSNKPTSPYNLFSEGLVRKYCWVHNLVYNLVLLFSVRILWSGSPSLFHSWASSWSCQLMDFRSLKIGWVTAPPFGQSAMKHGVRA